jgi:hypothetical protein
VNLPFVSFSHTYTFLADGAAITSDSTLRFRSRAWALGCLSLRMVLPGFAVSLAGPECGIQRARASSANCAKEAGTSDARRLSLPGSAVDQPEVRWCERDPVAQGQLY